MPIPLATVLRSAARHTGRVAVSLALWPAVGASAVAQAPAPLLWSGLSPGPHQVGYWRVSRGELSLQIWYPAAESGRAVRLGEIYGADREQAAAFLARAGISAGTVDSLLASTLYATASPRPEAGPFPLVLIAHGNGQDGADQAVLSEYVASHGFVVVSTPSPMRKIPMEREDQAGEFAERQASALADAAALVAGLMPVDTARIGIIGHSFGARAALLAAMRDPRVRALVSLDGGIGTATAAASFRSAPSFRSDAPIPPLLHFHEELDEFMKPDFTLLRSLEQTALVLEPTRQMHHVHFTTLGFAASIFAEMARVTSGTAGTRADVVMVAERTVAFLREHLGNARRRDRSR